MTKPKLNAFIPGAQLAERAAQEREFIIAYVAEHPGCMTAEVATHMSRSIAAASAQLRLLLAQGSIKVIAEKYPRRVCHYFPLGEGEEVEEKPTAWDYPKQATVNVWKSRPLPPMFEPMAFLFGRAA